MVLFENVRCRFFVVYDKTCIISGGRPEGSKHNLKFQSAMWHHFKHFQSEVFFFSCCLSFTALELFCHNYMENP